MNQAAHIYANYLVSRNLAMAVALLAMLVLRARRMLAGPMVLVDAIGDATTGRASLLPIILVFAIAFLLGASGLSGHPFWQAAAWRDTVGTVDPPS